jgi:hypothetical protein
MTLLTPDGLMAVASLWKKTKREFIAAFGGSSMLPAIAPGQNVKVRCGEEAAIGDVIVTVGDAVPIVHRVIAMDPLSRWLLTRGDANVFPDIPISDRSLILGRLIATERNGAIEPVPALAERIMQHIVSAICVPILRVWFAAGFRLIQALIAMRRWSTATLLLLRRTMHA